MGNSIIQLDMFNNNFNEQIRRVEIDGEMMFSIIDVFKYYGSGSSEPKKEWARAKNKLAEQGFDVGTKMGLHQFEGQGQRKTPIASLNTFLRIAMIVPFKNWEKLRQWMVDIVEQRIEEQYNPELGVSRAYERAESSYIERGKDSGWISTRFITMDDRKEFTLALGIKVIDIQNWQYAGATNAVYKGLWGRDARKLKEQAGLSPKQNLRDTQHRIALHYQGIVESVVAHHLGNSDKVTYEQAIAIIDDVASTIGIQANELCVKMGIDLPTNRPLLKKGHYDYE